MPALPPTEAPRGSVALRPAHDVNAIEAPVTWKAYFICAFASVGGIFFGYDSSYINGVNGAQVFIHVIEGPEALSTSANSLIVSILSAGTFVGALMGGDLADWIGRKWSIIFSCIIFGIGVVIQMLTGLGIGLALITLGRLISGIGVGLESAIVILYCPRKVRGALVACYQFAITIGTLLAAIVVYATSNRPDTGSYRIPIAVQFVWAIILGGGLLFLPDSPRYFVKKGKLESALQRFQGFVVNPPRLKLSRMSYQKLSLTASAIKDSFLISLIFSLINVVSTPLSFWLVERFRRRPLLLWGALGMVVTQYLVAIVGIAVGFDHVHPDPSNPTGTLANNVPAVNSQIAFIAIYIFFFATTWSPGAWIVIGEIYPLPIRARGVALATASNWLWSTILSIITPYMVDKQYGDLRSWVFFVWGTLCATGLVYTYYLVPETRGLSLEQVYKMMEESTPRTSAKWRTTRTFGDSYSKESTVHVEEAVSR